MREAEASGRVGLAQQLNDKLQKLEEQAGAFSIPNEFGSTLSQAGGVGLNATTSHDATRYFMALPANKLELWFALEAERFRVSMLVHLRWNCLEEVENTSPLAWCTLPSSAKFANRHKSDASSIHLPDNHHAFTTDLPSSHHALIWQSPLTLHAPSVHSARTHQALTMHGPNTQNAPT